MAANYWESTQRRFWTFSKPQLALERKKLEESERSLVTMYPLADWRHLSIYFFNPANKSRAELTKIARPLSIRQQALATAQVYVRRFFTKVEIRRTNPLLVLATALYLACKMEECPQHIRIILAEARHCWGKPVCQAKPISTNSRPDASFDDISKIGECEFTLISELNSQLIVHHPYRTLAEIQTQFQLTQEENTLAWSIINDHYLTDLPLLYAPHVIAIAAMTLAVVLKPTQGGFQAGAANMANALQVLGGARNAPGTISTPRYQKLIDWLAESSVDVEAIVETAQELISLYQVWDEYNEKVCKDQIAKFVKQRGLDK
ncbi:C/H/G cyclin [Sporormia fimetaria CBS 119925]|uniref:RNA polymerase II holoenzyme cyclin-like subunit n=1 Tax=Sporormia fimetaria CBS 119925 TaxID=1340428 RepID=A0A6A6V3L3_9PLEO|nr:C/H/G cyclin [Sporormia fimetaria CBS 119925]